MKRIYIIKSKDIFKIGISNIPLERANTLKCGNPYIELIYQSKLLSNAFYIESKLHEYFSGNNISGEWFKFSNINKILIYVKEFILIEGEEEIEDKKEIDFPKYMRELYNFEKEVELERIETETKILKNENKNIYEFLEYINGCEKGNLYVKLIYKTIFGKTFKELQQEYEIKPKESLRDHLASEQLKEVEQMEMLVSSLIGIGMGYEEIKNFINERYTKQIAS